MKENPLLSIQKFGQSMWLDFIERKMIMSGNLKKLIDEDGIRGVTSNPQIFKDAIAEGEEYEDDIRLAQQGALSVSCVGEHQHQKSRLFRRKICRSIDRSGNHTCRT